MIFIKKITLLTICFIFNYNALNAGLVYFANIEKKQLGCMVKMGEDYYAVTSQTAMMSLGDFAIRTASGTNLKITGPLEISFYSDAARVKVDPGSFKDQAYEIGGPLEIGQKVKLVLSSENLEAKSNLTIDGIGMYSFSVDKESDANAAGSPILSEDGKIIGVMSKGYNEFVVAQSWFTDEKVKVVERKNKLAARLDVKIIWVDAQKAEFEKAAEQILDAEKFQPEFLPVLNFWCKNPYREIPDNVKYPKELRKWVRDHKYKTKAYDRIIPKCENKPWENVGLIESVMDGTLDRSNKLANTPKAIARQMHIKWKTPFLRYRGKILFNNWNRLNKLMEHRITNMEFMLPGDFKDKKSKKKKKK